MSDAGAAADLPGQRRNGFLPAVGTWKYHLLLSLVAICVLGPLGGIAASYMNFSLGFFIGGQVLAGILGSAVTYGYGAEGKHGANYMQTMAASVASMAAMGVLIQAMVWLGMKLPPTPLLVLFFCCVGMYGVGIGMMYTPILVDRLKLTYPSGLAVANILRALTDKVLLRRSIGKLGSGIASGAFVAWLVEKVGVLANVGVPEKVVGYLGSVSASTVGAGIIVGSRIAVPGAVMGLFGLWLTPYLREIGWLGPKDPFRKIGFLIALAMILGAAIVDLSIIGYQAVQRLRAAAREDAGGAPKQPLGFGRLAVWATLWAIGIVVVGSQALGQDPWFLLFAIVLATVFVLINGISTGITDSNPISSAFVICVLLMSALGLKNPITGLIAASVLLISCAVGVDMQQDRSTGARLGTNRTIQFRYQVIGILMGAVLAVVLAQTFMKAYPVLTINTFDNPEAKVDQWQSAMTYKFVGAIKDLGNLPAYKLKALAIGLGIGFAIELVRKLLRASQAYREKTGQPGSAGFAGGWLVDSILLPSPYALSFGGFVEFPVALWYAVGGSVTSLVNTLAPKSKDADVPEDMSTMSLVGGGLVAGEALFALGVGILGLISLAK